MNYYEYANNEPKRYVQPYQYYVEPPHPYNYVDSPSYYHYNQIESKGKSHQSVLRAPRASHNALGMFTRGRLKEANKFPKSTRVKNAKVGNLLKTSEW